MPAADLLGGAGIAAGSTITSGQRIHHTRPFTQNPHNPAARADGVAGVIGSA
jgi:hypothetical protein